METNEMVITIPEGYEIDKENSTFECIKFKKKVKKIDTWDDLDTISGYMINNMSEIITVLVISAEDMDKNVFISEKYAKAALAQISQLIMVVR